MSILHMETDTVHGVARQLSNASTAMQQEMQSALQGAANMDWAGPSRDHFLAELSSITRQIQDLSEKGEILGQRCSYEADEWEGIGANAVISPLPIIPIIVIGGVVLTVGSGLLAQWWLSKNLVGMSSDEAYKKIEDILDNCSTGRDAIAEAKALGVKFELGASGKGTYYDPDTDTMYIDPLTNPDLAAPSFIHELTHAKQEKMGLLLNPTTVDKDTYLQQMIRNEADAVIAEFRYQKQNFLLDKVSQPPFETAYWDAYNQKVQELKHSGVSMSDQELQRIASDFGREKIIDAYQNGSIKTSTTGQSYVDYYGNGWERAQQNTQSVM